MDHAHSDSHSHVNYLLIFLALCGCTALSVVFDIVHVHMSPSLLVFAVLAVAVAKAGFVMTYFMHLKFEGRWKFIILMPTAILGIGLMIALAPDVAMHYYRYDVMQSNVTPNEPVHTEGHGSHGAEEKSEAH